MNKITLSLAIFCTSALNGMETEQHLYIGIEKLSQEVQNTLIPVLNTYKSAPRKEKDTLNNYTRAWYEEDTLVTEATNQLKETVKTMDQKEFIDFIHVLADTFKFHHKTMFLAHNFYPTPVAATYFNLSFDLIRAIGKTENNSVAKMLQLINDGADVNFLMGVDDMLTPLHEAMKFFHVEATEILLNAGANPLNICLPPLYYTNGENAQKISDMIIEACKKNA